jgi:hypothetical protein
MQLIRLFWDVAVELDPAAHALDEAIRFPIAAPEPLRAVFAAAGFEAIDSRPIVVPIAFSSFDELWSPFLSGSGPAPAYVVSLHENGRRALRDRVRASVVKEPDGSIRLTARAWAIRGRRPT